jgi:glucose-6-phosphate isomerase
LNAWKLENEFLILEGQKLPPTSTRLIDEMRTVLEDPSVDYSKEIYRVYRDLPDPDQPAGMRTDMTVVPPGKIGKEFAKTHGHYHIGEGAEPYKLLQGSGMLLLQKPDFDLSGVEAVRLVKLPLNQVVEVPSGWGHTLINIGNETLVALNYQNPEVKEFYSAYEKKQGAAYYIESADDLPKLVPNKNYGEVPKPQTF